MRTPLRSRSLLAVAAAIGAVCAVLVASAAAASPVSARTTKATTLRACDGSSCRADTTKQVPSATVVTSFCTLGRSDLVATGSADRRGGFLLRADIGNPAQSARCDSNAEFGVVTNRATTVRFCRTTGACTPFANLPQNTPAAAFCRINSLVLLYVLPLGGGGGNVGGFVPLADLSGNVPTRAC